MKPVELISLFSKIEKDILEYIKKTDNIGIASYKERKLLAFIRDIIEENNTKIIKSLPNIIKRLLINAKLTKEARALGLTLEEVKLVYKISEYLERNILYSGDILYQYVKRTQENVKKDLIKQNSKFYTYDLDYNRAFTLNIEKQGLIGFVDAMNRKWTYKDYNEMLVRTTYKVAQNFGVLYTYEHIDLYKIQPHSSPCPKCAPFEGRVYSRSGLNKNYPSLAEAYGKIDINGPDDLTNTYLSIHPNCRHTLTPFLEEGKSKEELKQIREFSSFKKNPPTTEVRNQKQIEEYQKKQKARQTYLRNYKMFKNYQLKLGNEIPKTFEVFLKHKNSNSLKYQEWVKKFRK